ncbi:MAG: NTP transferase domain-containing protein [Symbiobacteriia bacterium]
MQYAVLLAAGKGTRMWPFSETRPKACLPVGLEPAAHRLARLLSACGARRLVVVTDEEAHLRQALAGARLTSRYVSPLPSPAHGGTASAALAGLRAIRQWAAEAGQSASGTGVGVVILPADLVLTEEDLCRLLQSHSSASGGTVATALVDPLLPPAAAGEPGRAAAEVLRPQDWLGARLTADGRRLEAIIGHARHSVTHRLSGALAVDAEAFLPWLEATPPYMTAVPVGGMPPAEADLAETLSQMLRAGLPVDAVQAAEPLFDLDKPWHLLDANRWAAAEICSALEADEIDPTATISEDADIRGRIHLGAGSHIGTQVILQGNAWIGAGVSIQDGAILEADVVVGDGARLANRCLVRGHSVIGPGCRVLFGADVEGVLMDGAALAHPCEIMGIVGRNVDIGAGTHSGTLRFDDLPQPINVNGRWETPNAHANVSFIGDFSRTGVGAIILPGVRIGVHCAVGPAVVLAEDLPSGTLVTLKQEHGLERKPWGPHRYGW